VDDLDQNRQFVISLLIRAGYEVDGAANGLEAVSAVQAKAYDVILMDAQIRASTAWKPRAVSGTWMDPQARC
jgi:CheY-like chemotaxis protein